MRIKPLHLGAVVCLITLAAANPVGAEEMSWVVVSKDKTGFVLDSSGKPFVPWGFNYDHDDSGRLLEDYWESEWAKVETHFAQMKKLGANVVRIHLQLGKFMDGPDEPNKKALDRLAMLLTLAEKERVYLDLTGLGCYHKPDVPARYDTLGEMERWDVQAKFWQAVAATCAESPAVFCYDLMNEPVVPEKIAGNLDFLCVHLYPEKGKLEEAIKTLAGFSVGKPVVIEETFPLKCSMDEFAQFIQRSEKNACGWIGFYWGKPPEELRRSKDIRDVLLLGWLDFFVNKATDSK